MERVAHHDVRGVMQIVRVKSGVESHVVRVRVAGLGMLGHWVAWGYKMPCNLVCLG